MEGLDLNRELEELSTRLEQTACTQMKKLVQELTTTGDPSLDETVMKKLKKLCRVSDDSVRFAFYLIMQQLKKNHAEIRLSASQVAGELFTRSHAFRETLVNHLNIYLAYTTGTEAQKPLPPPKTAAEKMKTETLKSFQQWYDKFGQGYKKLVVGYEYLKNCKHIDFNDIRAQSLEQQRKVEREEEKKQKMMALKVDKVMKEIAERKEEIEQCAKEADSCLKLLMPEPEDFLQDLTGNCGSGNNMTNLTVTHSSAVGEGKGHVANITEIDDSLQCNTEVAQENVEQNCDLLTKVKNQGKTLGVDRNSRNEPPNVNNYTAVNSAQLTGEPEIGQTDDVLTFNNHTSTEESPVKRNHDTEMIPENAKSTNGEYDNSMDIEEEREESDDENDLQVHGLARPGYSVVIDLEPADVLTVRETSDNEDVVRSLKEASRTINKHFLPRVVRWLETLSKNGGRSEDIKSMIDLKVHLETIKQKCVDLKFTPAETDKVKLAESEEEFEDVPEKEGFEPVIPAHLRSEYGLDKPTAASSGSSSSGSKQVKGDNTLVHQEVVTSKTEKMAQWNLREKLTKEQTTDPTSLAAAIARVKPERINPTDRPTGSQSSSQSSVKDDSVAPVVQFDADLAFWENPEDMEAPSIVKFDTHDFWNPREVESDKPAQHGLAAMKTRVFTFTGQFEPVKWKCRARMANGKLCERMDRYKCPFHGKVVARDKTGRPENGSEMQVKEEIKEEPSTSEQDMEDSELPPWKDPQLQREIEQATGKDLGSARSQKELDKKLDKGKGKGKKSSNLTDINAGKKTARSRIENKIFSKRAMKRVCATLDSADYRRVRDKFGNQFNYSLEKK